VPRQQGGGGPAGEIERGVSHRSRFLDLLPANKSRLVRSVHLNNVLVLENDADDVAQLLGIADALILPPHEVEDGLEA
jgi:hypothetical protein